MAYELWADESKVLSCQALYGAVASYYELCFTFQLKYPKECQLVSMIVQSRICKYGDTNGSLTQMKNASAQNKLARYVHIVGDIDPS